MKNLKIKHILLTLIFALIVSGISPSCATSNQAKIDAQRKGLMMQDKSEFSRNKRHYKGSKSFKKQMKRQKKYRQKRIKR